MNRESQNEQSPDDELSIGEILEFMVREWRKLLLAAVTSMIIVVAGAFAFGGYAISGLIINSNLNNSGIAAFDFVKWKFFQAALPNLAAELLQTGRVKEDEQEQFRRMSSPAWWDKNVVPVYAFSKDDSKLLGAISKELEEVTATIIQYLNVDSSGNTKEAAEKNLAISVAFVRSGSEYLTLRGMISNADAANARAEADIRKRILSTEVEMNYLEQRSSNLELLRTRFPNSAVGAAARGQILDLKDATSKYMPLDTQLVAINSDIYALEELLARLKSDQVKQAVTREFLKLAIPAAQKTIDGASLANELLEIVTTLRKGLERSNLFEQEALTSLEANIRSIHTSFDKGLQSSAQPQAHRASRLALLAPLSFLGGGLAMLIYVMLKRSLLQTRSSIGKSHSNIT